MSSPIKVIFLDVDGVLNNVADIRRGVELDPEKLQLFADLVRATGAKVVLSSSWRLSTTSFDEVEFILLGYGVTVADCTPPLVAVGMYGGQLRTRGDEIQRWLDLNQVERFAILDDVDDGLGGFGPNFFQTSFETGLTLSICNAIMHHLNKETITSEDVGDLDGLLKGAL
jgi:hypothetical protein